MERISIGKQIVLHLLLGLLVGVVGVVPVGRGHHPGTIANTTENGTKAPLVPPFPVKPVGISVDTLTNLCYAQCMAKCVDNQVTSGNKNATTTETNVTDISKRTVCTLRCLRFESTGWVEKCKKDIECLRRCHNLKNDTSDDGIPDIPHVSLVQATPHNVELSWSDPIHPGTVIYVIERSDDNGFTWNLVIKTRRTSIVTRLDVCLKRKYRVAAVSGFGTHGFSEESTVTRTELPSPGPVKGLRVARKIYDKNLQYFFILVRWDPPEEWRPEHVGMYQIFLEMEKHCTDTMLPPVPIVDEIKQAGKTNTTILAKIRVFYLGYTCVYRTPVRAVSKCNVRGEPVDLYIDLTDCEDIPGFPCPTIPPMPPGDVTNVTCKTNNKNLSVLVTWSPPNARVDTYVVQWGIISPGPSGTAASTMVEIDRRYVPGNVTQVTIFVNSSSSHYGVKILPTVNSIPFQEMHLSMSGLATNFSFSNHREYDGEGNKQRLHPVYIGVPVGVVVLLLVVVLLQQGVQLQRRRRAKSEKIQGPCKLSDNQGQNHSYLMDNPLYTSSDPWEVPRQSLRLGEVLGKGAFGQVVVGELLLSNTEAGETDSPKDKSTKVAVKMLLEGADETLREDFEQEIELMKTIGAHPNVVSMLGCCTLTSPICLIVEYMITDLLHFLRRRRHVALETVTEEDRLSLQHLLSFARQIAIGMEYLSQKGFVHRDLATRNVLVGDRKTVKIGDFGLTRYVYDDHVYVTRRGKKLPLKWMAIEAIFDLVFTTQTDVWAYGVVLYELVTLGGVPYPTVSNKDLLRRLQAGYRLERPETCPTSMYEVMLSCWRRDPDHRPSFTELRHKIEALMEEQTSTDYITICVGHDDITSSKGEITEDSDDISCDDITIDHDIIDGVHIISDEEEVADDVFDPELDSTSHSRSTLQSGSRSSCSSRGYQSDSSGVSSCHQSNSELVSPKQGDELLLVPGNRLHSARLHVPSTVPGGAKGPGHPLTQGHVRVVGKRQDHMRVSTCSQDRLISSSFSEGFCSDDGTAPTCLSVSLRGETYL